VTITHNDAAGLRVTLESLRPGLTDWPASEWEHVVVDGSPALSRPVLDDLPVGWPLVHLARPPRGVPDAFNQALTVVRGTYVWFLNGGDRLHDPMALARMLATLDRDPATDFVCGGAYLSRHGAALYPTFPRRTFLASILGRNWIYHQTVIYRRASLDRLGPFSTAYRVAEDYDHHVRGYIAGIRGTFTDEVLVDYDMGGGSSDVGAAFREFRLVHRSYRHQLPTLVNWGNEIVRTAEYGRIMGLRRLSATRLGAGLRPAWTWLNRRLRQRGRG